MIKSSAGASASGGCGCLGLIVTIVALWALIFGVTYGGKHHEMSCSCNRGVEVSVNP